MIGFRKRIHSIALEKGSVILANDLDDLNIDKLENKTLKNIKTLEKYLCAIKFNFHLILPLGENTLRRINKVAHDVGLQTIADIKLNDIGNTNKITLDRLWKCEFDAVIVNPIMGPDNLRQLIKKAHDDKRGVITLVHMSHPGAKVGYGLQVRDPKTKKMITMHDLFLKWSKTLGADGVVVGSTVPNLIKKASVDLKGQSEIYSPGVGTQGGNPQQTLNAGANYLIVGRTIINSKDPKQEAKNLQQLTIQA
ncbi:MAG: orotidine-5'-phosphate decarboxylase [Nitrososphaera sp.]|jgi:orotidine-5'-phosphate decarboxylase